MDYIPVKMIRVLSLLLLVACGSGGDEFTRSCNGKAVPNCLPYALSIIEMATVEPDDVAVDDPAVTVDVHIELSRCEMLDRNHTVAIQIRTMSEEPRIFDLVSVRDDGVGADAVAGDGIIDKTLDNPFFGPEIPANREVFLRFQARTPPDCSSGTCLGGTCRSERFEIPYRIGARLVR